MALPLFCAYDGAPNLSHLRGSSLPPYCLFPRSLPPALTTSPMLIPGPIGPTPDQILPAKIPF